MFDSARPDHPKVLDVVDFGPNSAPHYLRLKKHDKQLVVTDYFIAEDLMPGRVVQIDGDGKIHVINVHGNRLELDTSSTAIQTRYCHWGPAHPYGVVLLPDRDD
jgi:hypothetical protein